MSKNIKNSIVGFPRIGEQRELKFVLEKYFAKKCDFSEVEKTANMLKEISWQYQKDAGIDLISINDFSYYDNILDTIILFGAIPKRFENIKDPQEQYFAMARGTSSSVAMSMTKWFNTNYHYIVPELSKDQKFSLNSKKIIDEYLHAKAQNIKPKINLIGPVSFLALSKSNDGGDPYLHFNKLLEQYIKLLEELSTLDDEIIVQFEEPYFVKEPKNSELLLLQEAYNKLSHVKSNIKIVVTTYFEHSNEATKILINTPIWAIGLDFVAGNKNLELLNLISKSQKKLFVGIIDGRNIWKNDLLKSLQILKEIFSFIDKENIIISTSCSLLHTPYTLKYETTLDPKIKNWLSFAVEKLSEVSLLSKLFFNIELNKDEQTLLENSLKAIEDKNSSSMVHNFKVKQRVENISTFDREVDAKTRLKIQKETLKYPDLATTSIGSFPQTDELRKIRREFKNSNLEKSDYEKYIKAYIDEAIKIQEEIGLDVLVHGEPERNDMVEYFAEPLNGFAFSANGWVQSYGTRCVKPPILYGDVSLDNPMTTKWITYAQSKTQKIVKGMLTGPVTIINWSFVRDDIPKETIAYQIALCLADEIDDLQKNGIKIIQVDEAAFKEGYPLRAENIADYEKWAVNSFKLSTSVAYPHTQIHTHMCYSDFNDIIKTIEAMDADVITIETARSGNRLLQIFKQVGYTKEIGPGVYDIHSPRVPSVEEIESQIKLLLEVLPKEQLWINPDCGLKTRKWDEVIPALKNMVEATKKFR
ncbi:MAG: 5-methyltetrahydropteroyltriglutamate--homocysteine S-methyltransferase [Arcobacteraceae bacterium]|jgi:5-methyltetrahydropteroyltriglutamate--homocysteine methyltransferase|nr:5-methyltetrahydropteroyltriglutamate--homocysteine S-methyltransferase [Arcobacteraceae bacterium]